MRARAGIAGAVAVVVCLLTAVPASGASPLTSAWPKGVTDVTDSPLAPRNGPALVAMGNRVLVFGGGRMGEGVSVADSHRDGAVFDLRTRRWRRIADAPFPLVAPAGVWTGRQVVIVGTEVACTNEFGENECRTGTLRAATYTPASNRWGTVVLPSDFSETNSWTPHAVRWTGTEAVFSLGFSLTAIDPATGTARSIPVQVPPSSAGECASERFDALVGLQFPNPATIRLTPTVFGGKRSDAETGPTVDAPAPLTPLGTACTRSSVVVASTDLTTTARYDVTTRRWSSVPAPPGAAPCTTGCLQYALSGHGDVVDAWRPGDRRALRYDARRNRWTDVAGGLGTDTSPVPVWAAGLGITTRFDAGTGADTGDLVVWRPV